MVVNDQTEPLTLRKLDEKTVNENRKILIFNESNQMRGTEFRSPTHGMCLIEPSLSNQIEMLSKRLLGLKGSETRVKYCCFIEFHS